MPADAALASLLGYLAKKTVYETSKDLILALFVDVTRRDAAEMLSDIVREPFLSALDHLESSQHEIDYAQKIKRIDEARNNFIRSKNAGNMLQAVHSTLYVGVCYDIIGNTKLAEIWYSKVLPCLLEQEDNLLTKYENSLASTSSVNTLVRLNHGAVKEIFNSLTSIFKPYGTPVIREVIGVADHLSRSRVCAELFKLHEFAQHLTPLLRHRCGFTQDDIDSLNAASKIIHGVVLSKARLDVHQCKVVKMGRPDSSFFRKRVEHLLSR